MVRRQAARAFLAELEDLGLSPGEAQVYVALLRNGGLAARELAEATGIKRSSVYAVLNVLQEKALVEAGAGYASRFRAVPPERALPSLIDHERAELAETLSRKEVAAKELAEALADLGGQRESNAPAAELVEVIRNPRAVADRFARLQLEANESIDIFVKAPFVQTSGNREEDIVLGRGIRVRSLYEQSILDDEAVRPHLERWIQEGENARVYPGELPFKLALIDATTALMPLETPDERRDVTSILIRNAGLGGGLALLFDFLWRDATPLGSA